MIFFCDLILRLFLNNIPQRSELSRQNFDSARIIALRHLLNSFLISYFDSYFDREFIYAFLTHNGYPTIQQKQKFTINPRFPCIFPLTTPPVAETQFARLEIPLLRCNLDHITYSTSLFTPIYPSSLHKQSYTSFQVMPL